MPGAEGNIFDGQFFIVDKVEVKPGIFEKDDKVSVYVSLYGFKDESLATVELMDDKLALVPSYIVQDFLGKGHCGQMGGGQKEGEYLVFENIPSHLTALPRTSRMR